MNGLQQLQSETSARLLQTGLPRKVLRHLIDSHGIGVGSDVLEVGCGEGALTCFLDRLGIKAIGMDESVDKIAAARRRAPQVEFHAATADAGIPFAEHRFDLVIVRSLEPYTDDLLSSNASSATAYLLSCIRPGGHLVFVTKRQPTLDVATHDVSCYTRHLSRYPGQSATAEFPDTKHDARFWWSILGRRARSGYLLTTFQTPDDRLPRADWLRAAEAVSSAPCCPAFQNRPEEIAAHRDAA